MMKLILEKGRPFSKGNRMDKEMRVYDLLDNLQIEYERVDHMPVQTMEACREIDKVLVPAVICKNLFLCNAQKTRFYLLVIRGDKKFKTQDISRQIRSSRLSFAPPEYMEKYLDIAPGAVSVMGLMNDRDNYVSLLVDEDVLKEEFFGCHPCVNTSSLKIRTADVFGRFLRGVGHSYTAVHAEDGGSLLGSNYGA